MGESRLFQLSETEMKTIDLIDYQNKEVSPIEFTHDQTVLDLRNKIAEAQGYEDYKEVHIHHGVCPLKDDELLRDLVGKKDGFFVRFDSYASVKSDTTLFIWRGKGQCNLLLENVEDVLDVGNFGRPGKFAIIRNE